MWTGRMAFTRRPVCRLRNYVTVPTAAVLEEIDHSSGIDLPVSGLRIDENRPRADIADRVGRGDEGERGNKHLVVRLHTRQQQGNVQGRGAVDRGDGVFRARPLRHHFLEPVDVAADGRDPVRIEAFLDVLPLIPANLGHDQGNEIRGRRRARGQLFRRVQLRYLPSSKLPIMLLRTRCATSSMP